MAGWRVLNGLAVAWETSNVDTDQLIPARFMSVPRSEGYGNYLLYDVRRDASGALLPNFPLNRLPDAKILVAGRNFGSGSSREAAVYALVDAGFQVVIAPSFGDIFAGNAINNGLLTARVPEENVHQIVEMLAGGGGYGRVNVELGQIDIAGQALHFELSESQRTKLMNGWDDIDLTKQHGTAISAYRLASAKKAPWRLK